jgi:hypothetical protein
MKTNEEFITELIKNLSQEISHKWRVQSFSKNKPSATIVAYIDARDGIDLLNKYAVYGWEREHYMVGNNTYCKVGIFMPDGSVQYRSDVGVESNTDGVKGEASDSFKRACVNWGIGGFLYELGIEYVQANEVKTNTNYPYCVNDRGDRIKDLTVFMQNNRKKNNSTPTPVTKEPTIKPADERIEDAKKALDKIITDTKDLMIHQKNFKATTDGSNFKMSSDINELVNKNDLNSVTAFYRFVTKK